MSSHKSLSEPQDKRSALTQRVRTPMGYFVLALLVGEAAFLKFGKVSILSFAIFIVFDLVLVILVVILAIHKPEALQGNRATSIEHNTSPLEVGSPVRIKNDIERKSIVTSEGLIIWQPGMHQFRGREATIIKIERSPLQYFINLDSGQYGWAREWLEARGERNYDPENYDLFRIEG